MNLLIIAIKILPEKNVTVEYLCTKILFEPISYSSARDLKILTNGSIFIGGQD